jgi:hypothetical protein
MAQTARDSVANARINSGVTYGVDGDPRRFGVNGPTNIDAADALENDDFAKLGMRVVTGRDRDSKISGER